MKSLFIKGVSVIIGLMLFSTIVASTISTDMYIKLETEREIETKITNTISKKYSTDKFAVTTNVTLLRGVDMLNNSSSVQSIGALQLEGILPTLPQKSINNVEVQDDNFKIEIKDITIWLDDNLNRIDAENDIRPFLFNAIDWLSDCNCLVFKTTKLSKGANTTGQSEPIFINTIDSEDWAILENQLNYQQDKLDKLEELLANMSSDDAENSKSQWVIDYLEKDLDEEKEDNRQLFNSYMKSQSSHAQRDSTVIMKSLDIVQDNAKKPATEEESWEDWALIAVVVILVGALVFMVITSNKGPKTVYLKPKKSKKDSNESDNNTTEDTNISKEQAPSNPNLTQTQTGAYEDDSVIQSDLKSIKQSAIKMSVGQRHGASQIVKDWLDDGAENDGEDDTDANNEKSKE